MVALASIRAALTPPWVRDPLWRRAQMVPSLDLRFADSKSLVDAVTGRSLVTFTRASNATFVNASGTVTTAANDTPRFTHDPTTLASLGLLPEEARTNLLLRSEEFDNASWTKTTITVTQNVATAPSAASAADRIEITGTNIGSFVSQSYTPPSPTTVAFSFYAKAEVGNRVFVDAFSTNITNRTRGWFNLSDGSVSYWTGSTGISGVPVGNGWWRVTLIKDVVAESTIFRIGAFDSGSLLIWGAQLEAGSFPTSYIPTTTATVTRAADVATVAVSSIAFNTQAMTFYGQALASPRGLAVSGAYLMSYGAVTDGLHLRYNAGTYLAMLRGTFGNDAAFVGSQFTQARFAGSARAGAVGGLGINGITNPSGTPASSTLTSDTTLRIGANPSTTEHWGAPIQRIVVWPAQLSQSTLAAITAP